MQPSGQHRLVLYCNSVSKMTDEELTALYEELSYPSAAKFRRAVQRKGGNVSIKDALAFVETYGQQQVTAPRQQYKGKIVADNIDAVSYTHLTLPTIYSV